MSSEVLRMNDGGHVCLDWYNEMEGEHVDTDRPTILMLLGMTGLHTAKLQLHRYKCVEILMLCVHVINCNIVAVYVGMYTMDVSQYV